MKRLAIFLLAMFALFLASAPALATSLPCVPPYYALSCDNHLYGPNGSSVDFSNPPGFPATGVTMATEPGHLVDGYAFVSQGSKVHVVHYDTATEGLSPNATTFDLMTETGFSFMLINDLQAAGPVALDGSEATPGSEVYQYPLYVAGLVFDAGPTTEAYYFVLDQMALLDPNHQGPLVLDFGPLCDGACAVTGLRVFAESRGPGAADELAHFVTLDPAGNNLYSQAFYKLTRGAAANGPWSVTPVDNEGVVLSTPTYPYMGMDANPYSGETFGVYPTGQVEINLTDGTPSCDLDLYPTDVNVWALDPVEYATAPNDHLSYHFLPAQDVSGNAFMLGAPEGTCPDPALDESVKFPFTGMNPTDSAILQWGHRHFLTYTGTSAGVEVIEMAILPWTQGDELVRDSHTVEAVSCPIDLTLLPPELNTCPCGIGTYCAEDFGVFPPNSGNSGGMECELDEDGNLICLGHRPGDPPPPECLDKEDETCEDPFTRDGDGAGTGGGGSGGDTPQPLP